MKDLDSYLQTKINEKHKTCLTDEFDNGYFWALKDIQEFINSKVKFTPINNGVQRNE